MAIFFPPKGTDEKLSGLTLFEGELVYNTTKKQFYTGDGQTKGGFPIVANQTDVPTKLSELENDCGFITTAGELDEIFKSVSGQFATKDELSTKAESSDIMAISAFLDNFATKSEIASLISSETDPVFAELSSRFATNLSVNNKVAEEISGLHEVITEEMNAKIQDAVSDIDATYVAKTDLVDELLAKADAEDVAALEASLSSYAKKTDLDDYVSTATAANFAKGSDVRAVAEENEYLLGRVAKLTKEVDALIREAGVVVNEFNPVVVKANEDGKLVLNDNTVDAIVANEEIVVDKTSTVTAKSMDIDNSSINVQAATTGTAGLTIDAKEDIAITNTAVSAALGTNTNVIEVHSAEVFKLEGVTLSGNTYNTIMLGQRAGVDPKYVDIINCNFDETASHINIWVGGWQDNAVVNVKNCRFAHAEQTILLGDGGADATRQNSLTLNISDCDITSTETNPSWHGFLGAQTLTKSGKYTDETAAAAINPFKKVTININNVTVNGVKLTKDNFRMGEASNNQQLWIHLPTWNSNVQFADYPDFFPTVYVDGELITQLA